MGSALWRTVWIGIAGTERVSELSANRHLSQITESLFFKAEVLSLANILSPSQKTEIERVRRADVLYREDHVKDSARTGVTRTVVLRPAVASQRTC